MKRKCKCCGKNKDITEFNKVRNWYNYECKVCQNERRKKNYKKLRPIMSKEKFKTRDVDKVYVIDNLNSLIPSLPKIVRCYYCRHIIGIGVDLKWRSSGYCSEWCHEMEHLPEIKHTCNAFLEAGSILFDGSILEEGRICGEACEKTRNADGKFSRSWRKSCDSCYLKKHGYVYQHRFRKYKKYEV